MGIWSSQMQLFHINYLELPSRVDGIEALSTLYQRSECSYPHRQHLCSGICQQARRAALTSAVHVDKQTDSMGQVSCPVIASHTRPRGPEPRSRSLFFPGQPSLQVLDTPQWSCGPDLGHIRQSRGGSVCVSKGCNYYKNYSLTDQSAPLGMWSLALLYAFPLLELISPTLSQVRAEKHSLIHMAPYWLAM